MKQKRLTYLLPLVLAALGFGLFFHIGYRTNLGKGTSPFQGRELCRSQTRVREIREACSRQRQL